MPSAVFADMPPPRCSMAAQPQSVNAPAHAATSSLSLPDSIAHLAFVVHRPRLNAVVVLYESHRESALLKLLHAGLHVAGTVDGAAHENRGRDVPVPDDLEASQALVHDRLFQHGLAPVAAAVERNVHRANLSGARPRKPGHLVETGALELLPTRGRGDHGLAFHHHAELAPLAPGHGIGIARGLATQVPGLVGDLHAPQPLDAGV